MKLPVISGKEAIRAFEKAGWSIERRAKSRHKAYNNVKVLISNEARRRIIRT
jgi:predicted RNA binding protein YcfA (HicA-like mRNA interferase family)